MLTIPAPTLVFEPLAAGVAALELPLTVSLGPVAAGGVVLDPSDLSTFGLVVYRRLTAGSLPEVWAPKVERWLPDTGPDPTRSAPLAFLPDQPQPWQGLIVAAGAVDAAGAPVVRGQHRRLPVVQLCGAVRHPRGRAGAEQRQSDGELRAGHRPQFDRGRPRVNGEKPENATQLRVQLRSPALATIGGLVIDRASPGAEVTLSNSAGASVVLRPDGSIELRPAGGRSVVVAGDLESERFTYQPAGGGPRKTLS